MWCKVGTSLLGMGVMLSKADLGAPGNGAAVVEGAHGHVDGRGIWCPTVSLYPLPLHLTILILTPLLTLAVLIFFVSPWGFCNIFLPQ